MVYIQHEYPCSRLISEPKIDCGEWFEASIFDSAKDRCGDCYESYRKKYKALKEKERREKLRGQTL